MNTADVFHPLDQPDFGGPEEECTCTMLPSDMWTTHYGAVDPATMTEPDPECRACFTDDDRARMFARPLSEECRLGYPTACTGVANPTQAPRDRVACHGSVHVARF